MLMRSPLFLLAMVAGFPAGAEVLSLRDPFPADLADRVQARVVADPAEVPPGALVHALRLPDMAQLSALPTDTLLVLADCNAEADAAPVQVAIPTRCDAQSLSDALAAADGADAAGRRDAITAAGFRIVDPAPSVPDGGLVIRAMPLELEVQPVASSPVITASLDPAPLTPASVQPVSVGPAPFQPLSDAAPRPGLPEPSIVLGDMAVLMTAGTRGPLGMAHPVREAIRQRDAAMFERLLGQGAFDPDADQVAAAIQTELARMGCYSGRVDGEWGGGSDSALGRYVSAGGGAQAGADPDISLFRAVVRGDSVTCAAAPAAASATPRATPRNSGPARTAPNQQGRNQPSRNRPAAAAPAQQAPASQGRQINPGVMGTGVFR